MTPLLPTHVQESADQPDIPPCPMSTEDILTWLLPRLDVPGLTTYCALRLGNPYAAKVLAYVARLRIEQPSTARIHAIGQECEYMPSPSAL